MTPKTVAMPMVIRYVNVLRPEHSSCSHVLAADVITPKIVDKAVVVKCALLTMIRFSFETQIITQISSDYFSVFGVVGVDGRAWMYMPDDMLDHFCWSSTACIMLSDCCNAHLRNEDACLASHPPKSLLLPTTFVCPPVSLDSRIREMVAFLKTHPFNTIPLVTPDRRALQEALAAQHQQQAVKQERLLQNL
eukprot:326291-Pelagomonas_calceolata.AAC.1